MMVCVENLSFFVGGLDICCFCWCPRSILQCGGCWRKLFIRQQVDLYLQRHSQEQQEGQDEAGSGEEQDDDDDGEDGDAEEEEEQDEKASKSSKDPESKRMHAKIDRAIKASLGKDKKKRAAGGGLTKACAPSPELQAIIGESELPRTQVVKQLWSYIREHGLQDPGDKRKIICDDARRSLFNTNSTDMFEMNKLLSKHIWPIDNGGAVAVKRVDRDTEDVEPKPKKQKTDRSGSGGGKDKTGGFLVPCPISEQLSRFLGADDGMVSRADAVKRMWDYIKENKLQDPSHKKMILCDEPLHELFDCDQFVGFDITELLQRHFLKSEPQQQLSETLYFISQKPIQLPHQQRGDMHNFMVGTFLCQQFCDSKPHQEE